MSTSRSERSAIGVLRVTVDDGAVTACRLVSGGGSAAAPPPRPEPPADRELLDRAFRQIGEYLAGKRREFTIPLAPVGTPFQRKVWQVMSAIPFGETLTYGETARRCGAPGAARAVGGACHRNPILLLQPCHRVVAAGGKPGGFGGGVPLKLDLLALERGDTKWRKK